LAQGIAAAIDWLLIGVVVSLSTGYHGQLATPHSTAKVVVYYTLAVLAVWPCSGSPRAATWP